jgi:hypothetical protein
MGGDGRGDEWWCHGCLKRLVDSHRDPTGKFEPLPTQGLKQQNPSLHNVFLKNAIDATLMGLRFHPDLQGKFSDQAWKDVCVMITTLANTVFIHEGGCGYDAAESLRNGDEN